MTTPRTADAGPLAALAFTAGLFATAVLRSVGVSDAVGIGVLAAIAVATSAFATPLAAVAVSAAPALFADHFFVAPYDSVDFAHKDLFVLIGVPIGGLICATAMAVARAVPAVIEARRAEEQAPHDRWLRSLAQPVRTSNERQSRV